MDLSPNDVRQFGLTFVHLSVRDQQEYGLSLCDDLFRAIYGSPPECISDLWEDLCTTNVPTARISAAENNLKGFKMFMMANYFLWTYPRNVRLLQVHFAPVGAKQTSGKPFWIWVEKIAAFLPSKIEWLPQLDDPNCAVFCTSVDGVDCITNERRDHPLFPVNPQRCSHKFKHGALRYEVGVAVYEDRIVWVNGPFKAGAKNDITILRDGQADGSGSLLDKLQPGKMVVADRGYRTGQANEISKVAFKRDEDPQPLRRFKARVMCRHETVNARLKQFKCLSERFRQDDDKHGLCFKAVAVIVQYHLTCGATFLYDV